MDKKFIQVSIAVLFLITACGQLPARETPAATSTFVTVVNTATLIRAPTYAASSIPTETPTASITPLPAIPTFTPTFDVARIVTVTPPPKVECPKENSGSVKQFATPNSNGFYDMASAQDVLTYLNSGGTLAQLVNSPPFSGEIKDLTGDGVSEIVFRGLVRYSILGCKDGIYQDLFNFDGEFDVDLEETHDLNKNGTSELILYDISHYGAALLYVFEWDGNKFRSLIDGGAVDSILATSAAKLIDNNGDGLKEIVVEYDVNQLCGGFGGFCDGTPARSQTTILGWNGQNYVEKQRYFAPAQYRFQMIQDGDIASSRKEYDKALSLYQEVIFSDKPRSYSPEIRDNLRAQWDAKYGTTPSPTSYPVPPDEYPQLAAYAYYRIVLLHLVQKHESDATAVYNTLQQKFGDNPYGQPYVEMATAFWNAYRFTHKMYDGCAAAIQYAAEHSEILKPLGSDYHGSQSHTYIPADVCPFR